MGVVFITVNQVLVRLWARCGRKSDRMWSVSREGSPLWGPWCGAGPPAAVAKCSEASVVHATGLVPVVLSKMIQYGIVLGVVCW
jgi:hypothetical protein